MGHATSEGEHRDGRNFSEEMNIGAEKIEMFTAGSSEGTTTATATISSTIAY